jgi:hypothetical protein
MYNIQNLKWQLITPQQAKELDALGVSAKCELVWCKNMLTPDWTLRDRPTIMCPEDYNAYSHAEIAVMLGYAYVPNNVKTAAQKLIDEVSIGTTTPIDCNDRLREAKNA